jgi:hypothetical protein
VDPVRRDQMDHKPSIDEADDIPTLDEMVASFSPEERAEFDGWCAERAKDALSRMEADDIPY